MINAPVLVHFNESLPVEIHPDASGYAVAVLFSYDLNKETWVLPKERTRQRLEDGKDFYCQTPFYTGIQPLYMVESYRYSVRYESMYMQWTIIQ